MNQKIPVLQSGFCLFIMILISLPVQAEAHEFTVSDYSELIMKIALADMIGEGCRIKLRNSVALTAPLELRKHKLVGVNRSTAIAMSEGQHCFELLKCYEWRYDQNRGFEFVPRNWEPLTSSDISVVEKYPSLYPAEAFKGDALLVLSEGASVSGVIIDFPGDFPCGSGCALESVRYLLSNDGVQPDTDTLSQCYWIKRKVNGELSVKQRMDVLRKQITYINRERESCKTFTGDLRASLQNMRTIFDTIRSSSPFVTDSKSAESPFDAHSAPAEVKQGYTAVAVEGSESSARRKINSHSNLTRLLTQRHRLERSLSASDYHRFLDRLDGVHGLYKTGKP